MSPAWCSFCVLRENSGTRHRVTVTKCLQDTLTEDCWGAPNLSFKRVFTPAHLCIGVFTISCFSLCYCSKPTKSLSPAEILEALLDLPPYPSPPMTEENESNESYQLIVQGCTAPELVLLGYKNMIQKLINRKVEAISIEGDLQWILSEHGTIITLTVVPEDTLAFVIDDEHYGKHYVTAGWVIPKGRAAEINTESEYVRWDRDGNDLLCSARIVTNTFRSFISSTGEGWLSANCIVLDFIYAEWDAHGHGFYESSTGSGSW